MLGLLHDVRQALRSYRRRPFVAAVAAATLALGIGAATTVFALVRGVLLEPLGFPEPDRLVRVYRTLDALRESPNPRLAAIWDRIPLSYLFAEDLRRAGRPFVGLGLYEGTTAVLAGGREPEEVSAALVDPELLPVLGVLPVLGRPFVAADAEGGSRTVLLGHGLWESAFGGDPGIVGRAVRIDGEPYTVVGVMPPGFQIPGREDRLWLPLTPSEADRGFRDEHRYAAIARLAPGVSFEAAAEELRRIAADLSHEHPATDAGAGVRPVPLLDTVVDESRGFLVLLALGAAVVLAVACVNVLHLLLVRGAARRRELALRMALGARRGRLVRALALEALGVALAGGAGGLLLALAGALVLPRLLAVELPRLDQVAIEARVVLFAFAASLLSALAAGLAPAVFATGVRLRGAADAGEGDEARSGGVRAGRAGGALVGVEVALTMALACAAALLAVSWLRLSAVDAGFEPRGVLVQELRLPAWSHPEPADRTRKAEAILGRLRALPGVRGAAITGRLPVAGPVEVQGFRIAGRDPADGDWTRGRSAASQAVTPGYFELLRVPLVAGRTFEPEEPGRVVVVDRSLAEAHWPEGGAVGAEIVMGEESHTVIGVVDDVRHQGRSEEAADLLLRSWSERPSETLAALVRFDGDPVARAEEVRQAIHAVDPGLALPPAVPLDELVAADLSGPRSRALFVGLSAGVALLLAAIGVYGVVAYRVGRRRWEIGVRMALGADGAQVRRSVLAGALAPAVVGVVAGAGGALAAGRLLESLVYGVDAREPAIFGGVAVALLAVCLLAAYGPALRASRVDPARALARR